MEKQLLKIEHEEHGIWYFTNVNKAAKLLGIQQTHLNYYIGNRRNYNGWNFEWVDGSDIIYRYINPVKI